jgi:hypothetical protein
MFTPVGGGAVFKPRWVRGPHRAAVSRIFGGHSEGETPLPIPNRAVKPLCADGTWCSRARESRSPPVLPHAARRRSRAAGDAPQAPRRALASASQPGRRPARRRRARSRWDPPAGSGSRPYSPSVAKSIRRSTPLRNCWPKLCRPWVIARGTLRRPADGTYVLQAILHASPAAPAEAVWAWRDRSNVGAG